MIPIDTRSFTSAMRRAATPVSVVTTDGPGGRYGVTVSSICTASAEPPQVLVCVHLGGPTPAALRANKCFAVNILDSRHRHVADSFAGRIERWRADRFACDAWTSITTGAPVLEDGLLVLDCVLGQELVVSTHAVFVGTVVGLQSREGAPLLYSDQAYRTLESPDRISMENLQL
ncbi:MAG: flavin reductase [Betaproteobacteria bacterium]|jgi:flavin reductase|nr:flavin reductase [Betaproteobacteria bacterium]